jgi:hypothetical protein
MWNSGKTARQWTPPHGLPVEALDNPGRMLSNTPGAIRFESKELTYAFA